MSLPLNKQFAQAVKHVKNTKTVFSLEDKLIIYAYTKQAIQGDCKRVRPKASQNDKLSLAKWKAWSKLKGLSKADAMKKYMEKLKKIDKTFIPNMDADTEKETILVKNKSPDQIKKELIKTDEEFQQLPALKDENSYVDPKHMSYIGGIDPVTQQNDDVARSDLLSRLTAFYVKHDKRTLNEGIGNIVDKALLEGEEALNEKLMKKYGEDLDSFEDETNIKNSIKLLKREKLVQTTLRRVAGKQRNSLDEKFVLFFHKNDPARIDHGFEVLHEYIKARGSLALNKKLFQKYGEDLDTMFGGKSVKQYKLQMREESATTSEPAESSSKNPVSKTKAMILEPPGSPGTLYALADDSHEMLTQYYKKYEPRRVIEQGVDGIYKWGQRNGPEALNRQLKKRFGESLEEFSYRAKKIEVELRDFYKIHDPSRLKEGLSPIVTWAIKNGRSAINAKLQQKFGKNLDNYKAVSAAEGIDF